MNRARLLRYSRCQLSDFAIERGLMVLILSVLNLTGPVFSFRDIPRSERSLAPGSPLSGQVVLIFASLILLAVLFSSQEIVSRQRKLGYYRLILAKPVNPVLFYAQLFVVHLVGSVLLISLIAALFGLVAVPVPLPGIAALTAIAFVLFGGIGFLISTLFNYDSVAVIALVALSLFGKSVAAGYTGVGVKFANLLVPVDHLAALKPLLLGGSVAAADVSWVLGYALTAFVLGLIAVRYRQLAD